MNDNKYVKIGGGWFAANKYKKTDKQPDVSGKGELQDGTPIEIVAWKKKNEKGTFYTFQISEPRTEVSPNHPDAKKQDPSTAQAEKCAQVSTDPSDSDIPF